MTNTYTPSTYSLSCLHTSRRYLHPLPTSSHPCDVLVHLAAPVTPPGEPRGLWVYALWHVSRSPDDTCEPWQSSWFTVAVSRLLCQTKHQHNVFSLSLYLRDSPPPKRLQLTSSCTQSGCSSFCNHMLYCKHCCPFLAVSTGFN